MIRFVGLCLIALGFAFCSPPQQTAHTFGASGGTRPPLINPNWAIAAWFIDPGNSTTCASDNNNCTSASCGSAGSGIGPCSTWREVVEGRWGCLGSPSGCPTLRQSTTITQLSDQTTLTDVVDLQPALVAVPLIIKGNGNGTSIATGTISNFTALNRTAGVGTLTQMQLPAPGVGLYDGSAGYTPANAVGRAPQLVIDSTTAGAWWVYKLSSGAIFFTTDPLVPLTSPQNAGTLVTAMTPSNGDSVTIFNPTAIAIARIRPIVYQVDNSQQAGVWLDTLRILGGTSGGNLSNAANDVEIGSYVSMTSVASDRTVRKVQTGTNFSDTIQNCFFHNFIGGAQSDSEFNSDVVTMVSTALFENNVWLGSKRSLILDGDVIARDSSFGGVQASCVYIDTSGIWQVQSGGDLILKAGSAVGFCTSNINVALWSTPSLPWTLDVISGGRFTYVTTNNIRNASALTICGSTVACNGNTTTVPANCNITINTTNLAAAFGAAGFANNAWVPGCGGIGNFIGPQ